MASKWRVGRLGDFMEASLGKMLDAKKNKGSPHPYLGNSNVRWGQFELSNLAQMRFEDHEEDRYSLRAGDLVVCEGGEPGRCAIWGGEVPGMKIQKALHRIRAKNGLTNEYLYYWLTHAERSGVLEPHFTGTTIKHLTGRALAAVEVPVPPVSVQNAIVGALKPLDERIDNLRKTNETLEDIAQALFKSWFVDFDPVRAKVEGREPEGIDATTAALFTSEFEDSELGPIPNGWRVEDLGQVVGCVGGATPSTKDEAFWSDGVHHWATPKDLSGLQAPVLTTTDRLITAAGLARISSGLLPTGTLLMSSRAPIGYLAIAAIPTAINQGFIAMPPGGLLPPTYLLFWARSNMELIMQKANGSTFMEISKTAFRTIKVCVPSAEVVSTFSAIAGPLLRRIELNEFHKASLAEARDTLLPRLISGKLHLPEAQALVDEAVA